MPQSTRRARRPGAVAAAAIAAGRALWHLASARLALRAGGSTDDVLRRVAGSVRAGRGRHLELDQADAAVRRARLLLPGSSCLPRSIATAALLQDADGVVVVLGARRDATEQWVAHAWVEVHGHAATGEPARTFQRLATYARATDWALRPVPGSGSG